MLSTVCAFAQPDRRAPVDTLWADSSRPHTTTPYQSPAGDSLSGAARDSIRHIDSLARLDSLHRARGIIRHGGPLGALIDHADDPAEKLSSNFDQAQQRYFTAFDILQPLLPAYPLSQGAPGLVRLFSYAGASPDAIGVMFNGRALRGPLGGAYDLELFPMEFTARTEVIEGARALLYGSGESLIAVNFVQPRFDVDGSYVRIWYAQGEHNLTGGDLTYARNIGQNSNLTLGFRRLPSDGEFANQGVSNWAAHAAWTWNPDEQLELSLADIYSNATRGQNGGLEATTSRAIPLEAFVNDETLREESVHHDITLTARWFPVASDSVRSDSLLGSLRNVDTTLHADGNLYYTYAARNLLRTGSALQDTTVGSNQHDLLGGHLALTIPLAFARLEANGLFELRKGHDPRLELGGLLELRAGKRVAVSGAAKIVNNDGERYLLVAAEGRISLGDSLAIRGTFRQRADFGSLPQLPIVDSSAQYFSDSRTLSMLEGGLQWHSGNYRLDVTGFIRRADAFQGYGGLGAQTVSGGSLRLLFPLLFGIGVDNNLRGTLDPSGDNRFAALYGTTDLFGQWRLFAGNLDLRVGTTLEYQSASRGVEYQSETGQFLFPTDPGREMFLPYPILTAYIHARLGSAFLRVSMRNILDNEFLTIYRYPYWGREVNMEVTWSLLN